MSDRVPADRSGESSAGRALLPVLFIGVFMAALDTAVIGPVVPALREGFGVDNRTVGLVISGFVLFSLCSTVLMANLSDRYGRRPIYLASVALFGLGSLLTALSPRFWMIIAGRIVQGFGAGGITPTAGAVVGDHFTPAERGRALGLLGATYGMAFVLGPPLAGLLMITLGWRWIFLLNLPIAALILVWAARVLPGPAGGGTLPFDRAGVLITFCLLAAFVVGITGARPWWLIASGTLLPVLIAVEARAARPMIPLSLFANRQLAKTYLLALGGGFGMGGVIFLTSIATTAYAVGARHAGFVLLPLVLASMLGSTLSGRSLHRLGPRVLLLLGFALLAAGYAGCALTGAGLWVFLIATIPVGLGLGVVVGGALRSIALDEAPGQLRASGQGLINICNAVGTLGAIAIIGALADRGGGAAGFTLAYLGLAGLMAAMLTVALRLAPARTAPVAVRIRTLDTLGERQIRELGDVLIDCVDGGASVSFLWPMTRQKADAFWSDVAARVARGERRVLIAETDSGGIVGTVQIALDSPENQPHRGDLAKMLVHRRARGLGIGRALLQAAEGEARRRGKTLLILDTVTGGAAERLYSWQGWRRCGKIPGYALWPDGRPCATTVYYKDLSSRTQEEDAELTAGR